MPYSLPTTITFGEGSLERLPELLKSDDRIIALFTGGASFEQFRERVFTILTGRDVRTFGGVPPEPQIEDLSRATAWIQKQNPDRIVAIGGGSVMDLAKAAAFAAGQTYDDVRSFLSEPPKKPQPPTPVIAVPTTAGTGSEVTPWSVIWDPEKKEKYSLSHPSMFPEHALVDPELTYSMPPEVTANTGMDAFTQACEAYWNVHHNPTSDGFALDAVAVIEQALPKAVKNGMDRNARHDMMLGSLQAGRAFSNTRTAACHSISYPMTLFYGVPHGQAVGITLPEVLALNASAMGPERTKQFCDAMKAGSIDEVCDRIRTMMTMSGLKTRLSELGIDEKGIDVIVEHGFTPGRMGNNPYQFTAETMREMLMKIK